MDVNSFNISIIDTQENDRELVNEKTALSAPVLSYLGGDTKFYNLLTSELRFNFWVAENVDGKFFHLFTGSEKRFKVFLTDTSVEGFPKVLWSGFLLPEQFSEPYIHSGFWVNFTATDGIGLLKSAEYTTSLSVVKKSVLRVIADCLLRTGLKLDIYFSEAIINVGFNIDYLDLEVDTASYVDEKGKSETNYDVLVKCLESIGCTLFLYNNAWYIIGLKKFKDPNWVCFKYVYDELFELQFDSKITITRPQMTAVWMANPTITVEPPLKKMSVIWDTDAVETLIPEDIVTHMPVNIDTDINDRTEKYWSMTTNKSLILQTWLLLLNYDGITVDFDTYYNGFKFLKKPTLDDNTSGPFLSINNLAETITISDLENNFCSLDDSFFIYGSEDLERFGTLKIAFDTVLNANNATPPATTLDDYFRIEGIFTAAANNGVGKARLTCTAHALETDDYISVDGGVYKGIHKITKIDANTFDIPVDYIENAARKWVIKPLYNVFHFAITRKTHKNELLADEVIYLSSFDAVDIPDGMLQFEITQKNKAISGSIELEKIAFTDDGYYNIRLYPICSHRMLPGINIILFTELTLELNIEPEIEFVKTRPISFSTQHDLAVFHSSTRTQQTNKRFYFSDSLATAISTGDLVAGELVVDPVSKTFEDVLSSGFLWYTLITIEMTASEIVKIQNGYKIYVRKTGETVLEEIVSYTIEGNTVKQIKFAGASGVFFENTDDIFLKLASSAENLAYPEYWVDKWQRYDVEEAVNFHEAICYSYHDLVHDYNIKVDGTLIGLISPLELLNFMYKDATQFFPTSIELDLSEGKSKVVVIEAKSGELFSEFEGEPLPDPVTLNPAIVIASTAIEPGMFVFGWQISTAFTITDIPIVNATLVAKQMTDTIANGGVYTGLQKTQTITTASGTAVFNLDTLILNETGWFEVRMIQGVTESNLQYVQIAPAVIAPTETIELAVMDIGDILNVTGKYSIQYTGFTPTIVTQYLQKYDVVTQTNIGAPIVSSVSNLAVDKTVSFPSSGSWKVYLEADGNTSNSVAWLSIQF